MAALHLADGGEPQQGRGARTHAGGRAGMPALRHHHRPGHAGSYSAHRRADRCGHRGLSRGRHPRRVLAHGLGRSSDRDGPPQGEPSARRPGPRSIRDQLDYLEHQFNRHPASGTLHWAIAPFAPQRCTPKMLQGCAELADKYDLAVYTHVYETRGQVLIARELFADHEGSLISYMDNVGLLGPRLNLVHSVWIARHEIDRVAAADAGIVLNQLSNLKLKSGIAPIYDMRQAGVRLGLG